jgi:hypothetical protein
MRWHTLAGARVCLRVRTYTSIVSAPILAAPIVAAPSEAAPVVAAPVVAAPIVAAPIVCTSFKNGREDYDFR